MFPPDVVEKLWSEHELTQWEVQEVVFDPASEARWDVDEKHGGRVIVRGSLRGTNPRVVFVSLALNDPEEGVWTCITAFEPDDEDYGA